MGFDWKGFIFPPLTLLKPCCEDVFLYRFYLLLWGTLKCLQLQNSCVKCPVWLTAASLHGAQVWAFQFSWKLFSFPAPCARQKQDVYIPTSCWQLIDWSGPLGVLIPGSLISLCVTVFVEWPQLSQQQPLVQTCLHGYFVFSSFCGCQHLHIREDLWN